MRIAVRALVSPLVTAAVVMTTASSPGCVIISSNARPGTGADAGIDAFREERDSGTFDAGDAGEVLSREEATRRLLASFGENLALPTYRALATELAALETATAAYASTGSDVDREAARDAWRSAMEVVQRAELLQIGPAGLPIDEEMTSGVVGGQGLRLRIYTWPDLTTNRCSIDVSTQRGTYADLDALAMDFAYARSLAAVEYLLFYEGTDHGCAPAAAYRVDDAVWASFGEAGVRERRADHAHALVQLSRRAADELALAWEPSGGDFAGQLARAGQAGSPYPTTLEALNAVYAALFYADTVIKDDKVGIPSGNNDLCTEEICPRALESQWAGRAREHVIASLIATRDVFLGGPLGTDAIGFDDLLRSVGAAQLASDLERAIGGAIAAFEELPSLTPETLAANLDAVTAAYVAIQGFTIPLKTDVRDLLGLELPMGADGDND